MWRLWIWNCRTSPKEHFIWLLVLFREVHVIAQHLTSNMEIKKMFRLKCNNSLFNFNSSEKQSWSSFSEVGFPVQWNSEDLNKFGFAKILEIPGKLRFLSVNYRAPYGTCCENSFEFSRILRFPEVHWTTENEHEFICGTRTGSCTYECIFLVYCL